MPPVVIIKDTVKPCCLSKLITKRAHNMQGDHLSGKLGNVREFDSCQGNVRNFTKSQGSVRKNLVGEKLPKTVYC